MDRTELARAAEQLDLTLTTDQLAAFEAFEDALYRANEVMNLTRVARSDCWQRHFVDSLLLSPLIAEGAQVLDLGTGPGLPAWPLACARPDLSVTGLDSSGKMLGFLRGQPLPNLHVVQARAEEWDVREAFDFVTGRALAPLGIQLELSAAPCRIRGWVVPMRSATEEAEFNDPDFAKLGLDLEDVKTQSWPGSEVVRVFPRYRKAAATPKAYPRRWAEIRKHPLGRSI